MVWGNLNSTLKAADKEKEEFHSARYYASRAQEFEDNNQWEAAKRDINDGLYFYPEDPDLRYLNGRYYYQAQGDLQQARYNLIKALQENDEHYRARRLLVDVEDESGHFSSAICYINELLEFEPYDRDLWRRKINLYKKIGNDYEAHEAIERLARIYPNDSVVQFELAMHNRENWNQMVRSTTYTEAAANIERYMELDPGNIDYYFQVIDLYRKMGDIDRAIGAVNRGLMYFPRNAELIRIGANLLASQGEYVRALNFLSENRVSGTLYNNILAEVAADDRLRDPYEANGRLYARTGNRVALNYMLNTSLTRGYYEDAKYYLNESMKVYGVTTELLMKEYALEKRFGSEASQLRVLRDLYATNPDDPELRDRYADLMLKLAVRDMDASQWIDAEPHLQRALDIMAQDSPAWPGAISRQITLFGRLGRMNDARRTYEYASRISPSNRARFASAYEDVAMVRLKDLIEENRYAEALEEAQGILAVLPESESALRACINMSQTLMRDNEFHKYALLGYDLYPDNPYFVVKYAISLQNQGRYADALDILKPRPDGDHYLNTQLSNAYQGVTLEWVEELLAKHMPKVAIQKIDDALVYNPNNKDLLYAKGRAYEQLKNFDKAYELELKNYNPSNAELEEWTQHMRYLRWRSYRNRVSASYLYAVYDTRNDELGSVAHMYSIANVTYEHLTTKNIYTLGVNYKGIDGYIQNNYWDSGGAGFEIFGQWSHTFNTHWTMSLYGSWSNQYFNRYGATLGLDWYIRNGWSLNGKASYRRTPPSVFFFNNNSALIETSKEFNIYIATLGVTKNWERVTTSVNGNLFFVSKNIFYNLGWSGSVYVKEDRISHVGITASIGSFPELQFFDMSVINSSARTNASVGFFTQFLVTKNWTLGLQGTWNTYYNPFITDFGQVLNAYRNIYVVSVNTTVAF